MAAQTIALICNPQAGDGPSTGELHELLGQAGADVRAFTPDSLPEAVEWGPQRFVAAGGDGTLGPAAQAASQADAELAVLPVGTANNFALALGVPADLQTAGRIATQGTELRPMDLGYAGERPFVNLASAGLAVPAARRASSFKRLLGSRAYAVGALMVAVSEAPTECDVYVDGKPFFSGGAWQVMVAVTGAFGAGQQLAVAQPDSASLDVLIIEAGPRRRAVTNARALRRDELAEQPDAHHGLARAVTLQLKGCSHCELNVDGELLGVEPRSELTVDPEAYSLVVP
ncbi:MAG: diacylglycerol/lipid kinase family protein [Solirubrobacterales bacterium]